jgi:glycosyltransferase involved in cell wall biosynthesis
MPDPCPFVTVIMPVRNEADFIARSLGAVLAQDYPAGRLEVLIADGMSSDATRTIIAAIAATYPCISVRVLDNPAQIVASGLNRALAAARGVVIVRVDGHTIIAPDYVRRCVAALAARPAAAVGGRMTAVGQTPFGRAVALATSTPFGVGGARFHYAAREEWVDTVYMGAWPRAVFARLGGFDEEMVRNQDDEFSYRLRKAGGRILLSPRIQSRYYNRSTLRALARQYFQYGYWKVRVLQKHPRQMRPRQFAPPLLAAGLGGGALLARRGPGARRLWGAGAGCYALATLLASIWTARRAGWAHLPRLPLVFATLHLSYGLGFLVGLARFAGRWGRG